MRILKKFITEEKKLFYGFLLTLGIIMARIIFLETPELFRYGAEIGNLMTTFSSGYIVSYIFYFLVVYLKKQNDKKNISEYLIKYLSHLAIVAYRDFYLLKINSQISSLAYPPNKEALTLVYSKLHPVNSLCTKSGGGRYNWYDYYKFVLVKESNQYIEEIWKLLPYLDTELIKILNSLKESQLFQAAWGISREIIPSDQSNINIQNNNSIPDRISEYYYYNC